MNHHQTISRALPQPSPRKRARLYLSVTPAHCRKSGRGLPHSKTLRVDGSASNWRSFWSAAVLCSFSYAPQSVADRNNRTPRKRAAKLALAVASMAMFLAGPAQAATVSMSDTNAPPLSLGSILITNLFATYNTPAHGVDFGAGSNVGAGGSGGGSDGTYNYIADDKAAVGQSFTTGANAAGYKVAAVTLRAVVYTSTFSWVPSVNYAIRITKPAGTNTTDSTLTVLATETAEVGVDWANCPTCNIPSVGTGGSRSAGCGRYITFTLGTPVALLPNTLYGFDIGLNTDNIDNTISRHTFYWETDGRGYLPQSGYPPTNNYAGGNAYGSGPWNGTTTGGHGDLTLTKIQGSRAFIVSLNLA